LVCEENSERLNQLRAMASSESSWFTSISMMVPALL
jgi:hypothetical protein